MDKEKKPPCAEDPDLWFSLDTSKKRQAIRICERCPLRDACLQLAIDNQEEWGVWGGSTAQERARLFSLQAGMNIHCVKCKNKNIDLFYEVGPIKPPGAKAVKTQIECLVCGLQVAVAAPRWKKQKGLKAA